MIELPLLTQAALGVLLGGAFGVGCCVMLWALPRWRATPLDRRLAPYVRDVADPLGLTPLAPGARRWRDRAADAARRVGGADALARRLRRAGIDGDPAEFRLRQLSWLIGGLIVGAATAVGAVLAGGSTAALGVLPLVGAFAGALVPEVRLSSAVRTRERRVTEELPVVLEFLALCLAAGEGVFDAVRRVAAVGEGELARLLRNVVVQVGTGDSLADALRGLAADIRMPAVQRSIDQIVAAMDRGAPLAHVLQAQAVDAQDDARRALIEQAGRKEIGMLFPLVFLILPLSVLIAVFPGVLMLRLGS
ncbi:type II secretion system F family protein [Microbacterium sp. SORGH_AS_0888]|uniref:type II secretion system F family protein n=1 Tax=Microbacterium sp. SORGH_AS_0888 TaxID=3041791 RepID=UPI0027870BC0|nr:type II secretion system F family protein [Microbacterium sp. SORGH_AS_0888]MDQ1128244.1 tight adherence protein C [Microbacterium sp. SORGH_AS_0888]